jgi:hypothetical protein
MLYNDTVQWKFSGYILLLIVAGTQQNKALMQGEMAMFN